MTTAMGEGRVGKGVTMRRNGVMREEEMIKKVEEMREGERR